MSLASLGINTANKIMSAKNAELKLEFSNQLSAAKNPTAMKNIRISRKERDERFKDGVYSSKFIIDSLNNGYMPPGYNESILRAAGFGVEIQALKDRLYKERQNLQQSSKQLVKKLLEVSQNLDSEPPNLTILQNKAEDLLKIQDLDDYNVAYENLMNGIKLAIGEAGELDRLKEVKKTAQQQVLAALAAKDARLNSMVGSWLSGGPGAFLPPN